MHGQPRVTWQAVKRRAPLAMMCCALALGLANACAGAVASWGAPFPSLFVDPYNRYSAVSLPCWSTSASRLRYPDQLTAVDGRTVDAPAPGHLAGRALWALCAQEPRRAQPVVRLTFRGAQPDRAITLDQPIRRLGQAEVGFYFALYALVGLLIAYTGAVIAVAGRRVASTTSYVSWSLSASLMFITFYDYHTTMRMTGVFSSSVVGFGLSLFWLAYSFPRPPERGRMVARLALWSLTLAGAACALVMIVAPRYGVDPFAVRSVSSALLPLGGVVLLASVLLRLPFAVGRDRTEILSVLWGLSTIPALLGGGLLMSLLAGSTVVHLVVPFAIPLVPMSIGLAIIRYDLLDTRAVLTRQIFHAPILITAVGVALALWLALRRDDATGMAQHVPVGLSLCAFAMASVSLHRLAVKKLFPASAAFRPTIEQLAEALAALTRRDDLRDALERTVSRWLPSGHVRLLSPARLDEIDRLPTDALETLSVGQRVWVNRANHDFRLIVPMRSLGVLRGVLDIAPKHQGALFTEEDLALLDTIASLGAIALHNSEVIEELDRTRRLEIEASREDKALTLGALGADLAHEISHPLEFFRGLVRRGAKRTLEPDDVEIGAEEIDRLERMLASLRRLEAPLARSVPVRLSDPAERALVLVRDAMTEKGVRHEVEIPADCFVFADPDGLVQVFANLLRNAVQAVSPHGSVGVRAEHAPDGSLVVDVWDDGPGVPEDRVGTLFYRWVTHRTQEGGSGLGLAVAQRLVKSFEWSIEYVRSEGRTCFRVVVPPRKLVTPRGVDRVSI